MISSGSTSQPFLSNCQIISFLRRASSSISHVTLESKKDRKLMPKNAHTTSASLSFDRRYLYSAHNVAISPDVVSGPNVVDEHREESAEGDCIGNTEVSDKMRRYEVAVKAVWNYVNKEHEIGHQGDCTETSEDCAKNRCRRCRDVKWVWVKLRFVRIHLTAGNYCSPSSRPIVEPLLLVRADSCSLHLLWYQQMVALE